jgi:tripartite-type tricarboxylate transporter receptor subunit TctC
MWDRVPVTGRRTRYTAAIAVLSLTGALAACSTSASSQSAATSANYYSGKTIEILVPNAPGGNIDVTARVAAPFIQKYLGAAGVKVVDVSGASGITGLDQLWNSQKNGLTIGYTNVPVALLTGVVGGSEITYKPGKFVYLGRITAAPRLLVVSSKSPIKSLADLKGKTVKIPSKGFDDSFYTIAAEGKTIGFKPQFVTGFANLAAATDSLATGATTLEEGSLSSLLPSINAGLVRPLLIETSGPVPSKFQNLPRWSSVATQDANLVDAFTSLVTIEGSFFVPPGTPASAVTALRAAITKTATDKSFQAQATKAGTSLDYMSGTAEEAAVTRLMSEMQPYVSYLQSARASAAG